MPRRPALQGLSAIVMIRIRGKARGPRNSPVLQRQCLGGRIIKVPVRIILDQNYIELRANLVNLLSPRERKYTGRRVLAGPNSSSVIGPFMRLEKLTE